MKLKNKLIPLTTFATAVAAITPLTVLSSCTPSAKSIKGLTEPTFAKYEGQYGSANLTEAYSKFAKEQPGNFKADYTWGVYQNWMSFFDNSEIDGSEVDHEGTHVYKRNAKTNSIKFGMSTPKFSSHKIGAPGIKGLEYPTISFKINFSIDVKLEVVDGYTDGVSALPDETETHTIKFSVEAEYKNMPYFAYFAQRQNKDRFDHGAKNATPHWWITFASESKSQYAYRYAQGLDWGIKAKGNYSDEVVTTSRKAGGETKRVKLGGKLNTTINDYQSFESLAMLKNYNRAIWWPWFNPSKDMQTFPALLLANAVLMDNESYYFSDLAGAPEIEADDYLRTTLQYSDGKATPTDGITLSGWILQTEDGKKPEASTKLYLVVKDGESAVTSLNLRAEGSDDYRVWDGTINDWNAPEYVDGNPYIDLKFNLDNSGKVQITMPELPTGFETGGRLDLNIPASLVVENASTTPTFIDVEQSTPTNGDYTTTRGYLSFNLPGNYKYYLQVGNNAGNQYPIYPSTDGYAIQIADPFGGKI